MLRNTSYIVSQHLTAYSNLEINIAWLLLWKHLTELHL